MSVRKTERWQVNWRDGRARSRRFAKKSAAETFGRELERQRGFRSSIRSIVQWEVRWRDVAATRPGGSERSPGKVMLRLLTAR